MLRDARDLLIKTANLFHRMDESREVALPETELNTELFFDFDAGKNTTYQNVLLYVLELLRSAEYRCVDEFCCQQRINEEKWETHAWEPVIKVSDFIMRNVTKEINFQQWRNLTSPYDNCRRLTEHLCKGTESEFELIACSLSVVVSQRALRH